MKLYKNFGGHKKRISAIEIGANGYFIYVASGNIGYLKQWNVKSMALEKDLGKIHEHRITVLESNPNGTWLFSADETGVLKQWSSPHMKLCKNYGRVHTDSINGINIFPGTSLMITTTLERGYMV
jgi:WD40 repeat protein